MERARQGGLGPAAAGPSLGLPRPTLYPWPLPFVPSTRTPTRISQGASAPHPLPQALTLVKCGELVFHSDVCLGEFTTITIIFLTWTPMLIAALSTVAKWWGKNKCPSTDEWLNKMWYIHRME